MHVSICILPSGYFFSKFIIRIEADDCLAGSYKKVEIWNGYIF